mmetsp:Transcript_43256/g.50766  ORF Transcript_43256/g.50766 Transcript_43256/m.50766 type:complete len:626 (+) Transcript_43256:1317-3194(+)
MLENTGYQYVPLSPTTITMTTSNGMAVSSKTTLPGALNIGDPSQSTFEIITVPNFYPRPEATFLLSNPDGTVYTPCYSIDPGIETPVLAQRFRISYSTPSTTIKPVYFQCQEVPMTYDLYIDMSKNYPFWANFNATQGSLLVRPAFAEATDIKIFNVTYVAIPMTGSNHETGFQTEISMFNDLPTISVSYVTNILYALQPAVVDVLIEDPENNSIFYELSYNNGLNIDSGLEYTIKFVGTNHWEATFWPKNTPDNIGDFYINVTFWDLYHTNPDEKGQKTYDITILPNTAPHFVTSLAPQSVYECKSVNFTFPAVTDDEKDFPVIYKSMVLPSLLSSSEVSIEIATPSDTGSYVLGSMVVSPTRNDQRTSQVTTMSVGIGIEDVVLMAAVHTFDLNVFKDNYPKFEGISVLNLAIGESFVLDLSKYISDDLTPFKSLVITCFVDGSTKLPTFMTFNNTHLNIKKIPDTAVDSYNIMFNIKDSCMDKGVNSTSIKMSILPDMPVIVSNEVDDIVMYVNEGLKNKTLPDHLFIDPEDDYKVEMTMAPDNPLIPPKLVTLKNHKDKYVLIEAEADYYGNFTLTLIATDTYEHTASVKFKVFILDCVSDLCQKCNGPKIADCEECIPGF